MSRTARPVDSTWWGEPSGLPIKHLTSHEVWPPSHRATGLLSDSIARRLNLLHFAKSGGHVRAGHVGSNLHLPDSLRKDPADTAANRLFVVRKQLQDSARLDVP